MDDFDNKWKICRCLYTALNYHASAHLFSVRRGNDSLHISVYLAVIAVHSLLSFLAFIRWSSALLLVLFGQAFLSLPVPLFHLPHLALPMPHFFVPSFHVFAGVRRMPSADLPVFDFFTLCLPLLSAFSFLQECNSVLSFYALHS